jgi:hypothetical protein
MYARWIAAMLVLLTACRREPPPAGERTGSAASPAGQPAEAAAAGTAASAPASAGSAAAGSAAADAAVIDAAAAEIELLHGVSSTTSLAGASESRSNNRRLRI